MNPTFPRRTLLTALLGVGLYRPVHGLPAGRRIALLIGSGHFAPGVAARKLRGVGSDIRMMAEMLHLKYGFSKEDIWILGLDGEERAGMGSGYRFIAETTTRVSMGKRLGEFIAELGPGSYGVLGYSGHGGQIEDARRASGLTQYLVMQDGMPFFDFEINRLTERAAGRLTLFLDCCHAGGQARSIQGDTEMSRFGLSKFTRLDERLVRDWLNRLPAPTTAQESLPKDGTRILLAASSAEQEALELRLPGPEQERRDVGAFTWAVYHTVMRQDRAISYGEVWAAASRFLRNFQLGVPDPDLQGASNLPAFAPQRQSGLRVQGKIVLAGWLAGLEEDMGLLGDNRSKIHVTVVGPFQATIVAATPGTRLPSIVRVAFDPISISAKRGSRKGDDSELPPPDALVGGIRVVASPNPNLPGGYDVYVASPQGRYSIETGIEKQAAEAIRMQQQETLDGGKQVRHAFGDTAAIVQPFRLQLLADRPGYIPRYAEGETAQITAKSQRPGYLMLIGFNPDRSVWILYPNQNQRYLYLDRDLALPIEASRPFGITRLVAMLSPRPIAVPTELARAVTGRWAHYELSMANLGAFIAWMQKEISAPEDQARSFGTRAQTRFIAVEGVEVASLDIYAGANASS